MLGSMLVDYFSHDSDFQLAATARSQELIQRMQTRVNKVEWRLFDAEQCQITSVCDLLSGARWAINAIGFIKPYIHDDNAAEVQRAIVVNAFFPHLLARAAEQSGCRILQIATDCVYSGRRGGYNETDEHDPLDVYGKTKSLGEVFSENVYHLRCSIIGPEPKGHISLLDWFLRQPSGSRVNGYTNHQWNGVTTLHFAKLCQGVMKKGIDLPHVQHIVPMGTITKAELLQQFASNFHRGDIIINPTPAGAIVDRTLSTNNPSLNRELWKAGGYTAPLSVLEMVEELTNIDYRFS